MAAPISAAAGKASQRACLVPVTNPAGSSWADLRDAVRTHWTQARDCAKWIAGYYYARELLVPWSQPMAWLPTAELIGVALELFPALSRAQIIELGHQVQREYATRGHELIRSRLGPISTYRGAVACPIPAEAWSVAADLHGWSASLPLGRRQWTLRLEPGGQRAQRRLRQIVAGEADRGPVTIYEEGFGATAAGAKRRTRVMLRVTWLPLGRPSEVDGLLDLRGFRDPKDGMESVASMPGPL